MSLAIKKLEMLYGLAVGFQHQFYNINAFLTLESLQPFFAHPSHAKTAKAITSKYPELPPLNDKTIPNLEIIRERVDDLLAQMEPHYMVFNDFLDFKDLALKTMVEALNEVSELRMEINPQFTTTFMNLYVAIIQCIYYIVYCMEDKKLLLCGYALCYSLKNNGVKEESYSRIVNFLKDYSTPLKKIWEDYKPFGPKVVQFLTTIFPAYIKTKSPTVLRKEGALSITLNASKLSHLSHLSVHNDIVAAPDISNWLIFGLLASPEDVGTVTGAVDIVKLILSEGFNVPLFREETHFIHKDFEALFDYRTKTIKLDKHKKYYKEGVAEAQASAGARHRERRMYARQELNTLYNLLVDTPALIPPKLPLVLAALSMARDEIFWLLRHKDTKTTKNNPKDYDDNNLTEIIYLIIRLQVLIRENKHAIQKYYADYLRGPDATRLHELLSDGSFQKSVGNDALTALQQVAGFLKKSDIKSDYAPVREYWFSLEPTFASPVRSIPLPVLSPVVERMRLILQHIRFVDKFYEVLDEHVSLRQLYYFRDAVFQSFVRAIADGPNQPTHAAAFLILCSQFVENTTAYDPSEKERIGAESIKLATSFLDTCMDRIISLVEQVAREYCSFDYQYADYLAIYNILAKRPDFKPDKNYRPPVVPGSESLYSQRQAVETLRLYARNLWQLCSTLNEFGSITIYNTVFVPREFLVSRIKKLLRSVYARLLTLPQDQQPFKDETIPQLPSTVIKTLSVFFLVVKDLESYVDIDVSRLIKDAMIEQAWSPSVGVSGGKLDWLENKTFEYKENYIKLMANWYTDFFNKRIIGPQAAQCHICYSPARKGFYSRRGQAFRAEMYMDFKELQCLVSLIGPYGVKIIDREILRFIVANFPTIRDTLKTFQKDLTDLVENYQSESKASMILKNFRVPEVDAFVQRAIVIGAALQFRQLLHEALRYVCQSTIPILFNTIDFAFHLYPRNVFMANELVPMDSMAHDIGIDVEGADASLKTLFISAAQADVKLWDLLPAMFSVTFVVSTYWRDAVYNTSIGGYENNVHLIGRTISDLIVALKGLTCDVADEEEIAYLLRQFVGITAVLLLRVISGFSKEKTVPRDVASVAVFLDSFVEENRFLNRGDLESVMPYALLRSMWRSVHSRVVKGKTAEEEEVY